MCGVCGYIALDDRKFDPLWIDRMNEVLAHRGPEGHGKYISKENNVALGHTRLKIIDLSENASQPMSNADGTIWISFNGEIYNFLQQRKSLEQRGYSFHSCSDTEVALNLYIEHGKEFTKLLDGDFAIAIWDGVKKEIVLTRDRLGVRPLYYIFKTGLFSFASEIKAFFKIPHLRPEFDPHSLKTYFSHLCTYGRKTMFKDVIELLPCETLTFNSGTIAVDTYFDFKFKPDVRKLTLNEQVEGFDSLFEQALKKRLVSDVPVGLYLSGGIDSTYIASKLPAITKGNPIASYTLGFTNSINNEFKYSEMAAKKFNIGNTRLFADDTDLDAIVEKVIWHHDEPPPNIVSISQYCLAREAKPLITVALAGSGADEISAGYSHYVAALECYQGNSPFKEDCYHSSLPPGYIAQEFKSCNQKPVMDLLLDDKSYEYRDEMTPYYENNDYPDFIAKMQYFDIKTHFLATINKDDKMNMAWAVEGRFPFLDFGLVDYALSMSPECKIFEKTNKFYLKEIVSRNFNHEFAHRPKMTFSSPIENWLKQSPLDWNKDLKIYSIGLFNRSVLKKLGSNPDKLCKTGNNLRRIWGVYALEKWLDKFF